ncbi:retention module-containing protein [Moritella marina]|uniref:retention module-containing protein n=1 Tax=Moritella marina TaxID=90736 RepID=UPI0037040B9F
MITFVIPQHAQVISVNGKAEHILEQDSQSLESGYEIAAGDKIEITSGAQVVLKYADGSEVIIDEHFKATDNADTSDVAMDVLDEITENDDKSISENPQVSDDVLAEISAIQELILSDEEFIDPVSTAAGSASDGGRSSAVSVDRIGDETLAEAEFETKTFTQNGQNKVFIDTSMTGVVGLADTSDINNGLALIVTPATELVEGSVDTDTSIATSATTAPDGGTVTYAIDDTTNYEINETTGEVTLTAAGVAIVEAGNDLPDFKVTATSTSGNTESQDVNPANTTDVDDGLALTVTPTTELVEGSVDTETTIATSATTDPDGGTVSYAIDDTTNYKINETTGEVTLTAIGVAIVEAGNDLPNFNVTATSSSGNTDSQTVEPANTIDVDDGLTVTVTNVIGDINEGDADTDTVVANASSTNPDESTVTLTVSDTTHYSIDANGVITLTAAGAKIVNDGGDLPDFTVDATSTTGDSGSAPVNPGNTLDTDDGLIVTVTNVIGDINEGTVDTDTVVANASSTNPDGSTVTLTVSDTTNYNIDENGVITLTVAGAKIVNDGGDLPDFTVDATSTTGDSGSAPVQPGDTLDTDDGPHGYHQQCDGRYQ